MINVFATASDRSWYMYISMQVGRPVIYGLAAKGEAGARKVMQMLKDELELAMALAGCPSVKDISRSHVRTDRDSLQSFL